MVGTLINFFKCIIYMTLLVLVFCWTLVHCHEEGTAGEGSSRSQSDCLYEDCSYTGGGSSVRFKRAYEAAAGTRSNKKENAVGGSVKQTPLSHHQQQPSTGKGSFFATENYTSVVAQTGGTAKLPCVVRKFNNGIVSWIKKDQSPPTILTVGLHTYIADDRFMVEHARHLQNWGLVIKHVRSTDAGLYECQVSTHPTSSIFIELRVTEASAEIIGAPDLHVKAGSSLRLVCAIRQSTEPLMYVFWYHNQKMINHEPGVVVRVDRASSVLQLAEADVTRSGNYTCNPSNAIPAYINVHVLNATEEENPAAMLDASSSGISTALFLTVMVIVTVNLALTLDNS